MFMNENVESSVRSGHRTSGFRTQDMQYCSKSKKSSGICLCELSISSQLVSEHHSVNISGENLHILKFMFNTMQLIIILLMPPYFKIEQLTPLMEV